MFLLGNYLPLLAADSAVVPAQSADSESFKTTDESTAVRESEPQTQTTDSELFRTTDESPSAKESEPQTQTDKPEALPVEPVKKDIGEKTVHFVAHLPRRLGLFTANVVVAAPAIFVRRSVQCTASNTRELVGDTKNPILLVPAGTLSLYYGLTSGLVEGTTFGIINSWKHSADGHISKASLGLEDK